MNGSGCEIRNLLGFRDYNVRINWRIPQKTWCDSTGDHDIHDSHHYPWMYSRFSSHLEVVRLLRPMQGRLSGCGVLTNSWSCCPSDLFWVAPQQRAQHGRFPGGVLRCKHSMCFRGKGRSRKRSVRS